MSEAPLDDVDRAILYYLQEDGRRAITEIADAVDVPDKTVRNRIRDVEEEGVIPGYTATVNYDTAGIQTTTCRRLRGRRRGRRPRARPRATGLNADAKRCVACETTYLTFEANGPEPIDHDEGPSCAGTEFAFVD